MDRLGNDTKTIIVPQKLHERIKTEADKRGMKLYSFVDMIVTAWLERREAEEEHF
jgi:hypothetical protein